MRSPIIQAIIVVLITTGFVQGLLLFAPSLGHEIASSRTSRDTGAEFDFNTLLESDSTEPESGDQRIRRNEETSSDISSALNSPLEYTEYTLKPGDTLSSIWNHVEGPDGGMEQIAKAMSKAGVSVKSLKAGETIKYNKDSDGEITEFHKMLDPLKTLIIQGDSKQGYNSMIHEPVVVTSERTVIGTIERSFFDSAINSSIPYQIIDDYVDLFSGRLEFRRDLHPGDEFTLIYQEKKLESGELVGTGNIIGASLKSSDNLMAAIKYRGKDGKVRYFSEKGESLAKGFLRYPLQFTRISSVFSTSRFHPVLKTRRPHHGVDFAAPTGTPVRSVADGVVTLSGWAGGGGKTVKIQHGTRYATAYLHLSSIASGIKKGSRVQRGQMIGRVGATGLATGPHLHFSFYDQGRYVDPLKIKLPALEEGPEAQIPKEALLEALKQIEFYHENSNQIATTNSKEFTS